LFFTTSHFLDEQYRHVLQPHPETITWSGNSLSYTPAGFIWGSLRITLKWDCADAL